MKNNARKNKPQSESKAANKKDAAAASALATGQPNQNKAQKKINAEDKEILYQIRTKRSSDVLKAYITFTYRILHPGVSVRLMFYGALLIAPGIFFFKDLFWRLFFIIIGLTLILLGLFRQYISLAMTKRNDTDYKSGAEFTYNFNASDADFLRNDERFSGLIKYREITNFYYDDSFYYLGVRERELYILPKSAFTVGKSDDFESFIYKKSRVTCKWLPSSLKDQLKQRRAIRRMHAKNNK